MRIILLLLAFTFWSTSLSAKYGSGEIKLSDKVVSSIHYYVDHPKGKPYIFLVTADGKNADFWYCAHSQCVPQGSMNERKRCTERYGSECKVFMIGRSIKWRNAGVIAARGKERSFSSKDTYQDIVDKLTALGFLD